jgi:predicted enzyme related to lactoylglutathione lyase
MKKLFFRSLMYSVIVLSACTDQNKQQKNSTNNPTQISKPMQNLISIVEIPVSDYSRASRFYQSVLGLTIEEMEMDGNQMGVLPNQPGEVNVVLVKGSDYQPSSEGAVLYLNAGNDLQPMLDKVAENGRQVLLGKTPISPEMGYFALFIDTEGNKLGLHSTN